MYLTPLDKKLLRSMIITQGELPNYIIVSPSEKTIYRANGWEHNYVDQAYKSDNKVRLNMKPYETEYAYNHLLNTGLVISEHGTSPAVQVSYKGWYIKAMRRAEQRALLLNNIFFPAVVAVISSVITTLVTWLITTHITDMLQQTP